MTNFFDVQIYDFFAARFFPPDVFDILDVPMYYFFFVEKKNYNSDYHFLAR
jgi:hypothetical protein